jgi:steroid 5-alpha reductase family enzyme
MVAIYGCAALIAYTYLASVVTKNYSQVDRLWSIIPVGYVGFFAWAAGFQDARLNLMAGLVFCWGARLTFNFARKGGYRRGGEDYRWPILRERLGAVKFQLLNATFIAPYQNVLLLLITLPAYVAWQHRGTPLGALDFGAAAVFVLALVGETVADQQQWNFHQRKKVEKVEPPFLTTGLFRFARHPNFFCEQLQWWCIYAFGIAASGTLVNLGLPGPVLLVGLFQGSATFTERITLSRYPSYAAYQRSTPRQFLLKG